MPVRMLMYAAKVYSNYITKQKLNIYSTAVIKLPAPKCVCFYNGYKDTEDCRVFVLSDSFEKGEKTDIEVSVTMYNINHGHNKELLKSCRPLAEYAQFVNDVRKFSNAGYNLSTAINLAIDSIRDDAMIKSVMEDNRLEVVGMCIEEYTQERADIVIKKEMDDLRDENHVLTEKVSKAESERDEMKSERDEMKSERDAEKSRADKAEAIIAEYKARYGSLDENKENQV